jgi:hypothetical protein
MVASFSASNQVEMMKKQTGNKKNKEIEPTEEDTEEEM